MKRILLIISMFVAPVCGHAAADTLTTPIFQYDKTSGVVSIFDAGNTYVPQGTVNSTTHVWTPSGLSSAQVTFTQSGTGAVAIPMSLKLQQNRVDLIDFDMAKTGCDGAHDLAPAFNAAIAALANDGILRLPAGTCRIDSTINVNHPMTIQGVGKGIGPGNATAGGGTYIDATFLTGDVFFSQPPGGQGVRFLDMAFNQSGVRTSGGGIHISGVSGTIANAYSYVKNVSFLNQYNDIICDGCVNPYIEDTVHGAWTNDAIQLNALSGIETSAWVNHNWCFGNLGSTVTQHACISDSGGYADIGSNFMVGSNFHIYVHPSLYQSATYLIHNNSTEEATISDIFFARSGFDWFNVSIQDNEFSSIATGGYVQTHINISTAGVVYTATTTSGSSTLSAISGNMLGLRVGQGVSGTGIPANTTITAINVGGASATMSANATASGTAVSITQTTPWITNLNITGNTFNDYISQGFGAFNIQGAKGATISHNTLNNNGTSGGYAFLIGGTSAGPFIVADNSLLGYDAGKLYTFGTSIVTLKDNVGLPFANLPTAANGSCVFVTDGTTGSTFNAAMAGAGTGAFAGRINGGWVNHC